MADFNGDRHPDYAWFNRFNKLTAIWYLNNNVLIGTAFGPPVPAGWSLVKVGDFNLDGKPDYVLYNGLTRQTAIWYLNNNVYVSGGYGPTLPTFGKSRGWRILIRTDIPITSFTIQTPTDRDLVSVWADVCPWRVWTCDCEWLYIDRCCRLQWRWPSRLRPFQCDHSSNSDLVYVRGNTHRRQVWPASDECA